MLYQMKLQQNMIHPLLRGADRPRSLCPQCHFDSSPPARGRPAYDGHFARRVRFIPSCEGQTGRWRNCGKPYPIHPLLRGADKSQERRASRPLDSSPPARGRHSVFMRLSAALNTSLCNLHKCHFQLVTHHFLYI